MPGDVTYGIPIRTRPSQSGHAECCHGRPEESHRDQKGALHGQGRARQVQGSDQGAWLAQPLALHGLYTGFIRALCGLFTGSSRALHGVSTGSSRALHGSSRGLHGLSTGSSRALYGLPSCLPTHTTPSPSGASRHLNMFFFKTHY